MIKLKCFKWIPLLGFLLFCEGGMLFTLGKFISDAGFFTGGIALAVIGFFIFVLGNMKIRDAESGKNPQKDVG